jgi:hypothetical protein
MKVRYQKTGSIAHASRFNMAALAEVITGDDSPSIHELDVWLEQKQQWKPLADAFRDHDVITDDLNSSFFEPQTEEDRQRGFAV